MRRFSFKLNKNEGKGDFEVAEYDFDLKNRKFKMADSIWWPLLIKLAFFTAKLHKNTYERVFEVADHDSTIKIKKFKMADTIRRSLLTKFKLFPSNCTRMLMGGFLRSLITVLWSTYKKLKLETLYDSYFLKNLKLSLYFASEYIQ